MVRLVDRRRELEHLRRSLAAIPPGQAVFHRDQAIALLEELTALTARHEALLAELRRLVEGDS
jgi:hypothetical protein